MIHFYNLLHFTRSHTLERTSMHPGRVHTTVPLTHILLGYKNMFHPLWYLMQALTSKGGSRYCSITDENKSSLLHIAALNGWQGFVRQFIQVRMQV